MKILLKIYFYFAPLTPQFHKEIEPIVNKWVDKLNNTYYK